MVEELAPTGQDVALSEDSKPDTTETEKEEDPERNRSVDESSQRNRSKRQSRRMRELEQAQFSLELLKVRSTSIGGSLLEDQVPDGSTCQVDEHQRHSPRGSPASHGSFELLSVEDMETEGGAPQDQTVGLRDSNYNEKPAIEAPRATFYIASDQSPVHEPKFESPSESHKDRRESVSRRPVVVLISMQKESPVEEGELLAAQTLEGTSETGAATCQMTSIAGLEVVKDKDQPREMPPQAKTATGGVDKSSKSTSSTTREETADVTGISSSEVDIQIVLEPKSFVPAVLPSQKEKRTTRPAQAQAPSPVLDTKPPKAQKKSSSQTVIVNMVEKPSSSVFSPPRRKLPFSKYVTSERK